MPGTSSSGRLPLTQPTKAQLKYFAGIRLTDLACPSLRPYDRLRTNAGLEADEANVRTLEGNGK